MGGWFDAESAQTANVLAGCEREARCLELCLARFSFSSEECIRFSVAGASCVVTVGGEKAVGGGCFLASPGREVRIESPVWGARVYVSAAFQDAPQARTRLRVGDVLAVTASSAGRPFLLAHRDVGVGGPLRVTAGPQAHLFELDRFLESGFSVSARSNRVGLRLSEAFCPHGYELVSEPAGCGAVQVTPDGSVIVLGPDGPTIGGYPKIAHVVSADFDRLAQLRPGDRLTWSLVSVEQARALAVERSAEIQRRLSELQLGLRLGQPS